MFLVRKVLVKAPKVLIRWGEGLDGAQMIVNSYLSYTIYPDENYIFKIMRSKVWLGSRWWWATPISDTANTSTVCICSRLFSREMETQRNSFLTFTFSGELETQLNLFLPFTFSGEMETQRNSFSTFTFLRQMETSRNSILNFSFPKRKMTKICTVTTFNICSCLFTIEMRIPRNIFWTFTF